MTIKVGDLPTRDRKVTKLRGGGTIEGHPVVIWCRACGAEMSANRGDYFSCPDDQEMFCGECDGELVLTQPRTVREPLTPDEARVAVGLKPFVTKEGA